MFIAIPGKSIDSVRLFGAPCPLTTQSFEHPLSRQNCTSITLFWDGEKCYANDTLLKKYNFVPAGIVPRASGALIFARSAQVILALLLLIKIALFFASVICLHFLLFFVNLNFFIWTSLRTPVPLLNLHRYTTL